MPHKDVVKRNKTSMTLQAEFRRPAKRQTGCDETRENKKQLLISTVHCLPAPPLKTCPRKRYRFMSSDHEHVSATPRTNCRLRGAPGLTNFARNIPFPPTQQAFLQENPSSRYPFPSEFNDTKFVTVSKNVIRIASPDQEQKKMALGGGVFFVISILSFNPPLKDNFSVEKNLPALRFQEGGLHRQPAAVSHLGRREPPVVGVLHAHERRDMEVFIKPIMTIA